MYNHATRNVGCVGRVTVPNVEEVYLKKRKPQSCDS